MKRFLDLADLEPRRGRATCSRSRAASRRTPSRGARRQDPRPAVLQPVAAHARLVPGGHGAARRQLVRDHARPGHLAARDAPRRGHERRRGRARARRASRCSRPTRRARHPRLRRRQGPAADLAETSFRAMAALVDKPLINMESAINHPCQALADWKTMDDLGRARGTASSCCPGSTIRARCRSPCRPRRCTWPRSAAWKWSCCGRRASRCRRSCMDKARALRAGGGGIGARDQRPRRGAARARRCSTPRSGARRALRRRQGGRARCARHSATGASTTAGSPRADPRLPPHALPAGAAQRRRRRRTCSTVRAASCVREAYNRMPAQMAVLHRLLA